MTVGTAGASAPSRQNSALAVALALAVAVGALWASAESLLSHWRDIKDYQHGFLIVAVSLAWLALLLRRGAARGAEPSWAGSAALSAALLAWVVAVRAGFEIMHQLLWPLLLLLTVWAMAGAGVARRFAAAVGLLWFAIPVWDYGLPVLQRLSIFFSEHMLWLLGVPATVTEYRVTIPAGTFEIIEGCSGKRYFIVTLAVAYLAAALNHIGGWRLAAFLGLAAGLAMLTNWLRIVTVIFAGHVTDMQHYFVAVEHGTLGNVMFGVLLVAVLWLGRAFSAAPPSSPENPPPSLPRPASPVIPRSAIWTARLLPFLLLGLSLHLGSLTPRASEQARLRPLPLTTGEWQGPLPPGAGWWPHYPGAEDERRASYSSLAGTVEIYANLYGSQWSGRELIQYGNNLVAPETWTRSWADATETLKAAGGALTTYRMQGPDRRSWIIAYRYHVAGWALRSDTAAKLAYGWHSLAGFTPSGVLALASPCEQANCDRARARIAGFWEDMRLPLKALLPAEPVSKP